jgi:hypothetical protein
MGRPEKFRRRAGILNIDVLARADGSLHSHPEGLEVVRRFCQIS